MVQLQNARIVIHLYCSTICNTINHSIYHITMADVTQAVVDPATLVQCVVCSVAFGADDAPSVMTSSKCPLSTHLYAGMAHAVCQLSRNATMATLLAAPVLPNMPSRWSLAPHKQHPSTVQAFKDLKTRWAYTQAGQNAASFEQYVSEAEQCKFRLDQVGRSNNEATPPVGSIEPFSLIVPLLMNISDDGHHVTPKRPQLWISPSTLPFSEFRLLFTFSYSVRFQSNESQVRLMSESMRDIRRLVPSLSIMLPEPHCDAVVGRFWLQEGHTNQFYVVGIVSPKDAILASMYDKYIQNPPANSRMSWFFWQRHIDQHGEFKAHKTACENAFVFVSKSLNEFVSRSIIERGERLSIIPARIASMPASTIYIDTDIRTPCIRYRCNAVSSNRWWVFPPESEVDGLPSLYEFDEAEILMQHLSEAWRSFGAMPLIYNTSRYNAVYSSFPFTPRASRPVGIKLSVTS